MKYRDPPQQKNRLFCFGPQGTLFQHVGVCAKEQSADGVPFVIREVAALPLIRDLGPSRRPHGVEGEPGSAAQPNCGRQTGRPLKGAKTLGHCQVRTLSPKGHPSGLNASHGLVRKER